MFPKASSCLCRSQATQCSASRAGDVQLSGAAVTALRVGWAVLAGASGAAGAAVGELLLFHARLRCLGLSTYEFVLRQRARHALRDPCSSPRHEHSPEPSASAWGAPRAVLGGDQEPEIAHPAIGKHDGHLDPAAAASCAACGLPIAGVRIAARGPYRAFRDEPAEDVGSSGARGSLAGACAADSAASCSGQARREADVQGHRTGNSCSDVESCRAQTWPSVPSPSAGALLVALSYAVRWY